MKTLPRLCFLSIFGALSFSYTVAQNALITPETPSSTTTEQQFSHKINDNTYIYYYGQTCGHCKKVEDYLKKSGVDQRITIIPKEVSLQVNQANRDEFLAVAEELGVPLSQVGTPFIVVLTPDGKKSALAGEVEVIDHFKTLETEIASLNKNNVAPKETPETTETITETTETTTGEIIETATETTATTTEEEKTTTGNLSFLPTLVVAALADSINPCAFAVMLLLLTSILTKTQNKRKALIAGLLFSLAVFITYFLIGMGVLQLLGTMTSLFRLKRIVGIVGILVGLANLKDYFRYGKGFVMEVPMSWRPLMQKIIKKVVSPLGVFVIGVLISLFLLPCSSGPYLTILGYLSAESQTLNSRGYLYLTIYNLIFVLPMVAIALLIGLGYSTAEKIGTLKNKNTKLIHLIVGLLMLGLGGYVIGTLYWW